MAPVEELGLPIRIETRTGDTPQNRRTRQREDPPNMLLTTPESLLLLLSKPEAAAFFAGLGAVVVDEIHALAGTKRGDQLALGLARLAMLAPAARRVGLSATVAHPEPLRAFLSPSGDRPMSGWCRCAAARRPSCPSSCRRADLPWGGHMGLATRARDLPAHPRGPRHHRLRQYPRPGGAGLPGAVAAERRRSCRSRCTTAA